MSKVTDDSPLDPFAGDPADPAAALADLEEFDGIDAPLTPTEREDVLADIEDLDVFQALLAPRGLRGIVVDCDDCGESHFFGWDLMRSNLRHLLDVGQRGCTSPRTTRTRPRTSPGSTRGASPTGVRLRPRPTPRPDSAAPDVPPLRGGVRPAALAGAAAAHAPAPGPATGTGRSRFRPAASTAREDAVSVLDPRAGRGARHCRGPGLVPARDRPAQRA